MSVKECALVGVSSGTTLTESGGSGDQFGLIDSIDNRYHTDFNTHCYSQYYTELHNI